MVRQIAEVYGVANLSKRRSIGERLKAARSPEARLETVTDWVADWRRDQMDIVRQLEQAIGDDPAAMDWDDLSSATGQLRSVTERRFEGLAGLVRRLTEQTNK